MSCDELSWEGRSKEWKVFRRKEWLKIESVLSLVLRDVKKSEHKFFKNYFINGSFLSESELEKDKQKDVGLREHSDYKSSMPFVRYPEAAFLECWLHAERTDSCWDSIIDKYSDKWGGVGLQSIQDAILDAFNGEMEFGAYIFCDDEERLLPLFLPVNCSLNEYPWLSEEQFLSRVSYINGRLAGAVNLAIGWGGVDSKGVRQKEFPAHPVNLYINTWANSLRSAFEYSKQLEPDKAVYRMGWLKTMSYNVTLNRLNKNEHHEKVNNICEDVWTLLNSDVVPKELKEHIENGSKQAEIDNIERKDIIFAFDENDWKVKNASKNLNMSLPLLKSKMVMLNIRRK